jgi:hypothetical protein
MFILFWFNYVPITWSFYLSLHYILITELCFDHLCDSLIFLLNFNQSCPLRKVIRFISFLPSILHLFKRLLSWHKGLESTDCQQGNFNPLLARNIFLPIKSIKWLFCDDFPGVTWKMFCGLVWRLWTLSSINHWMFLVSNYLISS